MTLASRRHTLMGFAALFGTAVVAPLARALAHEVALAGFSPQASFLTEAQRALLAQVSERIVPTTDTPGAIAAGVPAFIEMMLAEWHTAEERVMLLQGLEALDAATHTTFVQLPEPEQDGLLQQAMDKVLAGAAPEFFEHFRQLVLTGYYTSEIGCRVEQKYLPVPGRYDGAYPYESVGRIFSS